MPQKKQLPTNNCFLYAKLPDQKRFQAITPRLCQTTNLMYALIITPTKYEETKTQITILAKENPTIRFQIREFATNKIFFNSSNL